MPCHPVGGSKLFLGTYLLHPSFRPEDESDFFFRNVCNLLQDHGASQPRRPQCYCITLYIFNLMMMMDMSMG
jgi:hypothetical protein